MVDKDQVKLIAPELTPYVDGVNQVTRVPVLSTATDTLSVNGREYIAEDTGSVAAIIADLTEQIGLDEEAEVSVLNVQAAYFDITSPDPFTVTLPEQAYTLLEPVPTGLWDLLEADVDIIVNDNTFTGQVERAARYLMAHLLKFHVDSTTRTLASSETVGGTSISFADPLSAEGTSLTKYGVIYRSIFLANRRIKFT